MTASFHILYNSLFTTTAAFLTVLHQLVTALLNGKQINEQICLDKQTNSMVCVRERTIPTERPPLVGEVIANFCG
jgi:hypothetical protein